MSNIARQYVHRGLAGCVLQKKDNDTGIAVGLYCAEQAGIDADGPWVTVCEIRGTICGHATQQQARKALALVEWCEICQATDMLKFVHVLFHLHKNFYQAHLFIGRDRAHALQLAGRWSLNGLQGCLFSTGDQKGCFQNSQLVKPLDMYYRGESAVMLNALSKVGLHASLSPSGRTDFSLLTIQPETPIT